MRTSAPARAVQTIQVDTELVARSSSGVVPWRVYVAQPSSSPKAVTAARATAGVSLRDAVTVVMDRTLHSTYTQSV